MVVAIITGPNGQDGTYLKQFLETKGYEIKLYNGNILDTERLYKTIEYYKNYNGIIEIYNLAAKVDVGVSLNNALDVYKVNSEGVLLLLETVKALNMIEKCRIFQASSSEIFDKNTEEDIINEFSLCKPFTIYGISKYSADLILKSYRKFYGFHVSSGVLFNHESPLRKEKFVTSKIVKGLKNVLNGTQEYLELGNIEARRDFGHAKDFVRAMWLIVQQDKPDDYIIATGKIHSIREFIELTLKHMNKNINWEGEDENEIGSVDGKPIIKISKEFYRPLDSKKLIADTNKIRKNINWEPEYDFNDIIKDMIKEMKP